MRIFRLVALILVLCSSVHAQTANGVVDSLGDDVVLDTGGRPGAVLVISTVDFSGTLVAEASANDGANWTESVFMMANGGTQTSIDFVGTPVTIQRFIATLAGGFVRVRVSGHASGEATITILASNAPTVVSPNVIVSTGGESANPLTEVQLRSAPIDVNCPSCSGGSGGGLTDAELRASPVPVSGTVSVGNLPATQPVSGPLTDSELRATPVDVDGSVTVTNFPATQPVSGTVAVSNLPAIQPVSGTVSVDNFPATQPVSGTVAVSGTVPVSGPLTDSQLRASAVPVSGTVGVSGTVPVSGPLTDAQLRASAVPVSGPLTDAQLRATPIPVSMGGGSSVTDSIDGSVFFDTVTVSSAGSSRILVYIQSTFSGGGAVATPEASVDGTNYTTVPLLRVGVEDEGLVDALTSANWTAGSLYVFNNYGASIFRIRVTTIGSPGSSMVTLSPSGSDAPANVQMVTTQRTNTFSCTMSSTATTLTQITGCGAPSGFPYPVRRYITGIQWSSSTISTTSNFMLLRAGTGSNCGTGTVDVWRGFAAPAFNGSNIPIGSTAIPLPLGNALCFIHAGSGTRFINIQGYIAP